MTKPRKPAPHRFTSPVGLATARPVRAPTPRSPGWYWRIDVTHDDGTRTSHAVGRHPDAIAAAVDFRDRVAPTLAADGLRHSSDVRTLRDLLDAWLGAEVLPNERGARDARRARTYAPRTVADYTRRARRVVAVAGDLPLSGLDSAALDKIRRARQSAPHRDAPHTVGSAIRIVVQAQRWGLDNKIAALAGAAPLRDKGSERPATVRVKFTPNQAEFARVLDAVTTPWARDALTLLWAWGLRIDEAANLTAGDVDFDRGTVSIRGKAGRGKVGTRTLPIDNLGVGVRDVLARLTAGKAPDASLWPVGHYSVHSSLTRHHLATACARAGVQRFTPHGIRRAVVMRLIRSGESQTVAAAWLGHSIGVMHRHYVEVTPDDLANAARGAAAAAALPTSDPAPDNVLTFPDAHTSRAHSANNAVHYAVCGTPRQSLDVSEDPDAT